MLSAGCTRPELAQVYDECMGMQPPPPSPPLPPMGPSFTGQVHDVFFPGLQPDLPVACYRIPSLLYVPPSAAAATPHAGALLAVLESKHGHVCGDGVNSTLVMRRSTNFGSSWGAPFSPFQKWRSERKWGQPQMAYDSMTGTALLMFSNETLSQSPSGTQSLGSVLQISSTDAGLTWTPPSVAQRVDTRDPSFPTGPEPTSGNGIQLRSGHSHAGRLIFSMDTIGYTGDQLLLSDDNAKTYSKSYALNQSNMNELQLVQLGNGSVMAVMRNNVEGTHRQAVAVSSDGGETFGPIHASKHDEFRINNDQLCIKITQKLRNCVPKPRKCVLMMNCAGASSARDANMSRVCFVRWRQHSLVRWSAFAKRARADGCARERQQWGQLQPVSADLAHNFRAFQYAAAAVW